MSIKLRFDLPKIPKSIISKKLAKKPLENLETIQHIENLFKKKRSQIIKMPPPRTPVILLLSGGLDTSIIWDILLRKYKLKVYPLFLKRGQIRMPSEEKAVNFFASYYKKTHPNLYFEPKKITAFIPPLEIRWGITKFGKIPIQKKPLAYLGLPLYSSLLIDYAIHYAYYLQLNNNLKIRDVFCGFMPSDGDLYIYETLTALRSNMLNLANLTNDFSWQLISLPIEKELGFFFEKEVLIKWAKENSLPIEKSNSCIKYSYFHCGECDFCALRQSSFKKANVSDKTVYLNQFKPKIIFKTINKILLFFITCLFLFRTLNMLLANFLYFFKHKY